MHDTGTDLRRRNLERLLAPRHVAFIGGRHLKPALRSCKDIGYGGEIWVVNPRHAEIAGYACVPSVAALPEAPDAVFLAVPAAESVAVVRELAGLGAGGCVCYAAGFAEAGPEGRALQARLVEAAGEMALLGPNCYGLLNYLSGAALWASQHGGQKVERGVALVSQSGNLAINLTMNQRSVPLSHVISVGNQAALGLEDLILPLLDEERVTGIGLYVEGLADVTRFGRAANQALRQGVPIVAIKVGRSEAAIRQTLSHTASLAGPDHLYDALFERLGVIRAPSLAAQLETLKLMHFGAPLGGRRLGVLACSGGDAALFADQAQSQGLTIPPLAAQQENALRELLPDFAAVANPLDYNTTIWGDAEALRRCFSVVMAGEIDAGVLVIDYPRDGLWGIEEWDAAVEAFIAARRETGVAAIAVSTLPELLPERVRARFIEGGIVPLQGLEEAAFAIGAAARYGETTARRSAAPETVVLPPVTAAGTGALVDEVESKRRLAAYGVHVPPGRQVAPEAAAQAAVELGFPVALKAVAPGLAHKSEAGAVALGLWDADEVAKAAARIAAEVAGELSLLVEVMVQGAVAEILVGVQRDPVLGLALVLGSGGELVELAEDSRTLLLPTDRAAIAAALDDLKAARLLDGYRSRPPGDREALLDAVEAIAAFAEDHRDTLLELDVNPLLVLPEGRGAVAVDALIRLAETD